MRTIVIPVDGEPVEERDLSTLEDFQAAVGGYFQCVGYPGRRDVFCYMNEDGKHLRLPLNRRATALLRGHMLPGDFVAGTMVLVGYDGRESECDLPTDITVETVDITREGATA